jgi:hypothetical protein
MDHARKGLGHGLLCEIGGILNQREVAKLSAVVAARVVAEFVTCRGLKREYDQPLVIFLKFSSPVLIIERDGGLEKVGEGSKMKEKPETRSRAGGRGR